jgi:alkanesulfonate monooxygenase SsuD/methylene tetrahydromethanopterin reductase-like flavin-dependent oxidoreductase (luciferase family)
LGRLADDDGTSTAEIYDEHLRLAQRIEALGWSAYFTIERQNAPDDLAAALLSPDPAGPGGEDEVTFDGQYFHFNEALPKPKPFQKPHPPIWAAVDEVGLDTTDEIDRQVDLLGEGA